MAETKQSYSAEATRKLLHAADRGNLQEARAALDDGADPNGTEGEMRNSPLMLTALHHGAAVSRLLLERGANPDYARRDGHTALMMAAFANNFGTAQAIIDAGANILRQDNFNSDAVMHALREGGREMADFIRTTAAARDARRARMKAEAELRQNIEDTMASVAHGINAPLRIARPLRLARKPGHA